MGIKTVYDLSATPFFLAGSGYREGTLFPWVVSDFALIDAIESGIVKVPRMPVDDDRVSATVTYLDLWGQVHEELPTGTRKAAQSDAEPVIPQALETALHLLYGAYRRRFESWERSAGAESGDTPPVFIVVCSNTAVSKLVFDWIAGHPHPELPDLAVGGELELFSNADADGRWRYRLRTILVRGGNDFDVLLICGFGFDAYSSETVNEFAPSNGGDFATVQDERQLGRLPVLLVRMNAELAMGEVVLKKTGTANLFTIFGEPDVRIDRTEEGVVVRLLGVDVYDPPPASSAATTPPRSRCG